MIRRRFLQLLAGAVVGTAATLHLPGTLVAKTAIGRRAACEALRQAYLEFWTRRHVLPRLIVAEGDLYDAFEQELTANERYVSQLSPRDAYSALLPEHLLFKGGRVIRSRRRGWGVMCFGTERDYGTHA